jgi:hypothetical protein
MAGELAAGDEALNAYIAGLLANPQKVATRKASEMALESAHRALIPEAGRRLGGPDRLEQHQDQGDRTASAPIMPGAMSITASANSAWPPR